MAIKKRETKKRNREAVAETILPNANTKNVKAITNLMVLSAELKLFLMQKLFSSLCILQSEYGLIFSTNKVVNILAKDCYKKR